jgi:putative copper resistance protein D
MNDDLLVLARILHYGSGMILVGVTAFRRVILVSALAESGVSRWAPLFRRWNQIIVLAGVVLLISGLLLMWVVAAEMSGSSLGGVLDSATLGTVLFQTQFGHWMQGRAGLAVGLGLLWAWMMSAREDGGPRARAGTVFLLGTIALLVSLAWMGHAAAGQGSTLKWRIGADALHLLAAAFWPTGLLPFAMFLVAARRNGAWRDDPVLVLRTIRRFSAMSLAVVGVLIATGIVNSYFLVRSFSALITTTYGRLLDVKLAAFLCMLGLAAWNRFRLLPSLGREAAGRDADGSTLGSLRRSVAAELAFGVLLLVIVAVMGITTPPP